MSTETKIGKLESFAEKCEFPVEMTKKEKKECVKAVFDAIAKCLENGEDVSVYSFGIFSVVKRGERKISNPRTQKIMVVKEHSSIRFRPGKKLKQSVNK